MNNIQHKGEPMNKNIIYGKQEINKTDRKSRNAAIQRATKQQQEEIDKQMAELTKPYYRTIDEADIPELVQDATRLHFQDNMSDIGKEAARREA